MDTIIDSNTMILDEEKLVIANQLISALRQKDWDLLSSIISDDVTWSRPGENLLSGITSGASGFIDRAKALVGYGLSLKLYNIQPSYYGFALSIHIRATKDGVVLDQQLATVCMLQGNKIKSVKTYASDVPNMNEFFKGTIPDNSQLNAPRPTFDQKHNAAHTFIMAMKGNDWDLMRSVMVPDVKWTLPGKSLLSGPAYGVDAVVKRAQSLKKFGVMFELLNILYGWDGVALALHNTGKRDELILDEFVSIVFQLDGGKVTVLTTHLNDVPGIERFFIPDIINNL